MKKEIMISVDIEADGPIPGEYSMLSIGCCVVDDTTKTFYAELKPISEKFVPEAVEVCAKGGLDKEYLKANGVDPAVAMDALDKWLQGLGNVRPIFVGFNATFDWMFTAYYLWRFLGRNPFGISALDIKAYYMGKFHKSNWFDTAKKHIPRYLKPNSKHTHNALDDAIEQAELFYNLLQSKPK